MPQSLAFPEICLGCAKAEEEVEADGDVVVVVGDIEGDNLLFLPCGIFYKREDKAAMLLAGGLHAECFASAIDERDVLHLMTVGHREVQLLPLADVLYAERAGPEQHAHHVVDAVAAVVRPFRDLSVAPLVALAQMCLAFGVGVPHLVHIVASAFVGTLLEVERRHVGRDDTVQGVAHHEETVQTLAGTGDEVTLVGRLPFPHRLLDVHGSRAGIDPNELPVEEEVVGQLFAGQEGCVLGRALGTKGQGARGKKYTEKIEEDKAVASFYHLIYA